MTKFVVTARLGVELVDSVIVYADNAYDAIISGVDRLQCSYSDVVSVVMIP